MIIEKIREAANKGDTSLGKILNYQDFQQIGRGGFGIVYKAQEIISKKYVAIKVMLTEIPGQIISSEDEIMLRRFKEEIRLLSQLTTLNSSDNIVKIYDYTIGKYSNLSFLIMEYCNGGNIADLIQQNNQLSIQDCLNIILQVLDGLSEIHRLGIHRDIKPENILLNYNSQEQNQLPRAKLSDFGLAKAWNASGLTASILKNSIPISQLGSISPDDDNSVRATYKILDLPISYPFVSRYLIRDWKNASYSSDVWSVGATLYYMLTGGRHPRDFSQAKSELEIIEVLRKKQPIPIQERNPELPTNLATVIDRALSEKEDPYYQTAREFKEALESSL
jgi:serine/threonine-protein kinase